MTEYKRTVEDELDWSLLNQLHSVVLQIGTFCFRTKQVCLTVLIAVLGIIRALDGEAVQQSFFAAGIIHTCCILASRLDWVFLPGKIAWHYGWN